MTVSNLNQVLVLFLIILLSAKVSAESWEFKEQSVAMTVAYEAKPLDEKFEGSKILLNTRYIANSEIDEVSEKLMCCARPSLPENMNGLLDAELHFGTDGADLEFTSINFTPWGTRWETDESNREKLHIEWDLLELGAMRYISDDALEVETYFEFSILRAGRLLSYRWSELSAYTVNMGMQASLGYAYAKSADRTYSSVNNPFAGIFFKLSLEHDARGELYFINRFVNGFSFSNPSRGHPAAREARVRFGYLYDIGSSFILDFYGEKRSFYFDEGSLPNLYTQSGIFGLQTLYYW